MPPATAAFADLPVCSSSAFAAAATADGAGALALACQLKDSGRLGYMVYLSGRFAGTLGDNALPLESGFVSSGPSQNFFFAHDARPLASVAPGRVFAGTSGNVEVAAAAAGAVSAQRYDATGVAIGSAVQLGDISGTPVLGGAADVNGHTLVIWSSWDSDVTMARWLGPDGAAETAAFRISGWADNIGDSAALPGGGVAVGGSTGPRWRGVMAAGATAESPAPGWLTSRGSFSLVRGGRAMLFGNEVVAPDGTSCGSLPFDVLGVGADGTVFAAPAPTTFRVYPNLLK